MTTTTAHVAFTRTAGDALALAEVTLGTRDQHAADLLLAGLPSSFGATLSRYDPYPPDVTYYVQFTISLTAADATSRLADAASALAANGVTVVWPTRFRGKRTPEAVRDFPAYAALIPSWKEAA